MDSIETRWHELCAEVSPRVASVVLQIEGKENEPVDWEDMKTVLHHELVNQAKELHDQGMNAVDAIIKATKDRRSQQLMDLDAMASEEF